MVLYKTAFLNYLRQVRRELGRQGLRYKTLMRIAGRRWRCMKKCKKEPFYRMARNARRRSPRRRRSRRRRRRRCRSRSHATHSDHVISDSKPKAASSVCRCPKNSQSSMSTSLTGSTGPSE